MCCIAVLAVFWWARNYTLKCLMRDSLSNVLVSRKFWLVKVFNLSHSWGNETSTNIVWYLYSFRMLFVLCKAVLDNKSWLLYTNQTHNSIHTSFILEKKSCINKTYLQTGKKTSQSKGLNLECKFKRIHVPTFKWLDSMQAMSYIKMNFKEFEVVSFIFLSS